MPDSAESLDRDPPTHATLLSIADAGFVVNIRQDGGLYVAAAYRDGETWVARVTDAYEAAAGARRAGRDRASGRVTGNTSGKCPECGEPC